LTAGPDEEDSSGSTIGPASRAGFAVAMPRNLGVLNRRGDHPLEGATGAPERGGQGQHGEGTDSDDRIWMED
jgi:hypothetical protein